MACSDAVHFDGSMRFWQSPFYPSGSLYFVGWLERSKTHQLRFIDSDEFREGFNLSYGLLGLIGDRKNQGDDERERGKLFTNWRRPDWFVEFYCTVRSASLIDRDGCREELNHPTSCPLESAERQKERGSNLRWSPSTVEALPGMCPNRSCGRDPGTTTVLSLVDRVPGELTYCKRAPCAR